MYIQRYNALYIENNHVKGDKLEHQFTKIEEHLISTNEGIIILKRMLDDDNEIVNYYVASTLISLFPQKCKEVLEKIQQGNWFLASNVKYVIKNYEKGNNYFEKFLAENKN